MFIYFCFLAYNENKKGGKGTRNRKKMKILKDDIKKNYKQVILDVVIMCLLLFCCYQLFKISKTMIDEGGKCLKDPLKYYNEEMVGDDTCYIHCLGGRVVGGEYSKGDKKNYDATFNLST